ncbi:hypothetical protein [Deinococcus ficus]|uniref:Aromatic ring-opening dioxygenase LigA n=1 Tax=Deinococcus ficus TaxID=317577 RepID=A0A221T0Z3_9DEIO|nr:hypothetical protein [Deinococcus ficus]ASN82564.1 hypothetical protein DFI_15420 [Deinococcus ficus]
MNRSVLDRLISYVGLALAAVLLIGGVLLTTASSFINAEVHNQLASQKITMPAGPALESLKPEDKAALEAYAGQEMTTGKQAKAFADHYIGAHMNGMSGGRTYEEVSGEYIQMTDKSTPKAQKLGELRQTLFMGNTLRGMLLNAYAFGTMASIAGTASIVAYVGAVILVLLSLLGFRHARQTA